MNNQLWYRQPAEGLTEIEVDPNDRFGGKGFSEALPFGNGSLGGMMYSLPYDMKFSMNKDTIWSGTGTRPEPVQSREKLEEVRRMIHEGKSHEAHEFIKGMLGYYNQSYMPLGDFHCVPEGMEEYRSYKRSLDISKAEVTTEWETDGERYSNIVFSSYPDDCIAYRMETTNPSGMNARIYMESKMHFANEEKDGVYWMYGDAPTHVDPNYKRDGEGLVYEEGKQGICFACGCMIRHEGGSVAVSEKGITLCGVISFEIYISCKDGYRGYGKALENDKEQLYEEVKKVFANLGGRSFEEMRKLHREDYQSLYGRMELELPAGPHADCPTDERLEYFKKGEEDEELCALYVQYARYLMISSSRPGCQAANLQGIWNEDLRPAWSSNYTTNINVEMNYWFTENANLWECMEPFERLVREMSIQGKETAKKQFFCRGWAAGHNVDLWRQTSVVDGGPNYAYWPMSGVWMSLQLLTHYEYTKDKEHFREILYPVIRGAAQFCLDWLIEEEDGKLHICPSTSPENEFLDENGEFCALTDSCAMDITMMREMFTKLPKAMEACGIEDPIAEEMKEAEKKLVQLKVGSDGCLLEWGKEEKEKEKGHRHFSPLYGVYPGDSIDLELTPKLAEAAYNLMIKRIDNGSGHTGWSSAWLISLFARMRKGELALRYLKHLIRISPFTNMFGFHPRMIFQIDANFGAAAGAIEMLFQTQNGVVRFLPALPAEWKNGRVTGLRGRDALTADIVWENGEVKEAVLTAPEDVEVCLDGAGCVFEMDGSAVEAKMDGRYQRIRLKKDVPLKVRRLKI